MVSLWNVGKIMENSTNKILSIVIPIYNGEKYISNTIKNILTVKNPDIELLLIDDGSTDNSSTICKEWCEKDTRIRYERIKNSGIANARNKGIELAQGKYICFCDQDDEMVISVYEQLVYDITEKSATMGICSTGRTINGDKSIYEVVEKGYYENNEILKNILLPILFRGYNYSFVSQKNYMYGTVWKCIFLVDFIRKNKLKFVSFVDYEDDWIFVTQALSCCDKVITTDSIGYYWKVNATSKSHEKKYIYDIIQKLDAQDAYVYKYLLFNKNFSSQIFNEYKKIRLCEHYVDVIENVLYADNKNIKNKNMSEIRQYLHNTKYKEMLECQKNIQKTAFRRRFVCKVLQYAGISMAMYFNLLLRWCETSANKIQWLVKLERKGKLG